MGPRENPRNTAKLHHGPLMGGTPGGTAIMGDPRETPGILGVARGTPGRTAIMGDPTLFDGLDHGGSSWGSPGVLREA